MRLVLITDGDLRSSLAVVRSLGRAGYRCYVCSSSGRSLAGSSRYAQDDLIVPDSSVDRDGFADAIGKIVENLGIQMVMPMSEASLLALLPVRHSIGASFPFPGIEEFSAVCNKSSVLDNARRIGIRIPHQVEIHSPAESRGKAFQFPLVLKPHASVVPAGGGGWTKVGVSWVEHEMQLNEALDSYPDGAFPILAQEVIRGVGIGVFVLMSNGEPLAHFAHRRVREKPPSGGVSVISQSEPIDAELLDATCCLLRMYRWSGVAMVEYKLDQETSEPVLMEINGRFWGSLQLAIDAGVDFPRLLADLHFGDAVSPVSHYDAVQLRWFWGDVDNLIAQWRSGSAPSRLRALGAWVKAFGAANRSEVFRWSDPVPFLRETATWISDLRAR